MRSDCIHRDLPNGPHKSVVIQRREPWPNLKKLRDLLLGSECVNDHILNPIGERVLGEVAERVGSDAKY